MRRKNFFDVENALQVGTDSEGGYLVPDEFEHTLVEALEEENCFRGLPQSSRPPAATQEDSRGGVQRRGGMD